jgi:hypothetical protein
LYKVDCGRAGLVQVVHVDRIRKAKSQILSGEIVQENSSSPTEILMEDDSSGEQHIAIGEEQGDTENTVDANVGQSGRVRKKPVWSKDYVFKINTLSISRSSKSSQKAILVCPLCRTEVNLDEFCKHVLLCTGSRLKCPKCLIVTSLDIYKLNMKKRRPLMR